MAVLGLSLEQFMGNKVFVDFVHFIGFIGLTEVSQPRGLFSGLIKHLKWNWSGQTL